MLCNSLHCPQERYAPFGIRRKIGRVKLGMEKTFEERELQSNDVIDGKLFTKGNPMFCVVYVYEVDFVDETMFTIRIQILIHRLVQYLYNSFVWLFVL